MNEVEDNKSLYTKKKIGGFGSLGFNTKSNLLMYQFIDLYAISILMC
jgi:hypothetical protein